ncbi:toll/interleukin-1 receptor domain-containing protein [Priestia aryabhattai]|uniref:toll/interleukin-1 receptor domain-containing protein n=1 Tax=Priestia aryabhattai TaxID=412384 RepID=UPI002E1FFA00|nr:toll/interleukin-1 receptor domain-containing protein [Priestia aryabhattai]
MTSLLIHALSEDHELEAELKIFLEKSGYKNIVVSSDIEKYMIDELDYIREINPNKFARVVMLITQEYSNSVKATLEGEMILDRTQYHDRIIPILIDDAFIPPFLKGVKCKRLSSIDIRKGELTELTNFLSFKEKLLLQQQGIEAAEKEIKQEVIKRISDSSQLKEVILDLKNKEKINKRIAMGCYFAGIAGIIFGAVLAYLSVSNIPGDKKSYYYVYIGAKNLAIIGVLILCSRYTFNIGKIYMDEAVKHSDRLHAIHYGKFFLESFQEKLTFEEMKELFKDWNMDNKPTSPNTLDPTAADPNTASISGKSEAGITVDLLTRLTDLLSSQKK